MGKTTLCLEMIRRRKTCFRTPVDSVVYVYQTWQESFREFENSNEVHFIKNIFDSENIFKKSPGNKFLVFNDDHLVSVENDKEVAKYIEEFFVHRAHHEHLYPVFICHNIFSKAVRLISLNAGIIILFRNIRDSNQISTLGSQLGYGSFLKDVLSIITCEDVHGFLVIDLNKYTPDRLRLRNFLWIKPVMKYFMLNKK